MWSSAVELVNAREEARQKRQEALLHGDDADRPLQPAVHWVPSRDVSLGPRYVLVAPVQAFLLSFV